uniref:Transcriptional regulator, MarR family n=1 Tax=Magnetococcus massalia (strain MO-1) TaxID=451514 RepID=A0A1S7LC76_MAGMO
MTALELLDPTTMVGYTLKQAQHALRKLLDQRLKPYGLTVPQVTVLNVISREPGASNARLARLSFITPQSMQGVLVNLERKGLIQRSPDPEHGRIRQTTLTEEGVVLLNQVQATVMEVEQMLRQEVEPLEYAQVLAMLGRFRDRLESKADP